MDELPQIYAACIIEYARRKADGVLVGPFYVLGKDARDAFNLPYNEKAFVSAIAILEDLDALKKYARPGMQTFYRIESKGFDGALSKAAGDVRYYSMKNAFEREAKDYSFLEAFHDIGSDYLHEALESYEEQINDAADDFSDDEVEDFLEPPSIDSTAWTGLPSDFSLSELNRNELIRELDRIESELPNSGATQQDQAQARALVVAVRALLEAPEPQLDLAWEMIGRANSLAGIASLFVSIIALFLTAAH